MSYEPTNWKSGDVVTSNKLNKLEAAVAGAGILIVEAAPNESMTVIILNKTYAEITGAGFAVAKLESDEGFFEVIPLSEYGESDGTHTVVFGQLTFTTDAEDGYPATPILGPGGNGDLDIS